MTMYSADFLDPKVYVLGLEEDCFYVGHCTNFPVRIKHHITGRGALWTKMHRPLQSLACYWGGKEVEKAVFLHYLELYGIDRVRGWDFSGDDDYNEDQVRYIIGDCSPAIEVGSLVTCHWFKPMTLEYSHEWEKNRTDRSYTIWQNSSAR